VFVVLVVVEVEVTTFVEVDETTYVFVVSTIDGIVMVVDAKKVRIAVLLLVVVRVMLC
jgi:hypothetical protein